MVVNTYDHERARWGLGDVLVSLAVYFALALGLIVTMFAISGTGELPGAPWVVVAVVGPQLGQLLHLLVVSRYKGTTLRRDFHLRFRSQDISLGFGLCVVGFIGAALTAAAMTALAGEPPAASAVDLAEDLGDGGITVWVLVFAVLGATFIPVVEELVFRGLLWSALEKRGLNPWVILFVTSAVFASLHLELWRTPVLFVLGLTLGYARLRTGRLGPAIVVHILFNTLALTATLFALA